MKKLITGNHTVSFGAKISRVEVIAAYPITPQTEIVEKLSEMVASGQLRAKFIKVESEHSALAACIGASAAGCRTFTATASQGLALMHEMLHWASGARLPVVMVNVSRAMAPPWNVWNDQTDSLAQRDTGWIQFYCENNQEIIDTIIQAYKISEKVNLPAMIILDAFILSHTSEPVDIPEQKKVDKFLPSYNPEYKLDVDQPRAFGGLVNPEWYYEFRYKIACSMEKAKGSIKKVGREFGKKFGRSYGLVEKYKSDTAKIILIVSGSLSSTAKEAVDRVRKNGLKAGLIRIRVFRPFPKEEIRALVKEAKVIGVLDRNISFGNEGIFFSEVKSALFSRKKKLLVYGFVAGLGGRDVRCDDIEKIINSLNKKQGLKEDIINWIGLKK
ncbi:MAG: transketolase C-terminal domain-containing protein [Candidatus Omnitrophota bacterium]|nr:transketolase C-terminal domain-containing protein [Candidatus Omnitrophota bacterium]